MVSAPLAPSGAVGGGGDVPAACAIWPPLLAASRSSCSHAWHTFCLTPSAPADGARMTGSRRGCRASQQATTGLAGATASPAFQHEEAFSAWMGDCSHLNDVVEVVDEEDCGCALARDAPGQPQQQLQRRKAQPVDVVVHLPVLPAHTIPWHPQWLLPGSFNKCQEQIPFSCTWPCY